MCYRHLAGRSGDAFFGPPAHSVPYRRINGKPFRVVRVLVACQTVEDGLAEQSVDNILGVLAGSPFREELSGHLGQPQKTSSSSRYASSPAGFMAVVCLPAAGRCRHV
jgi:hypothetical protein